MRNPIDAFIASVQEKRGLKPLLEAGLDKAVKGRERDAGRHGTSAPRSRIGNRGMGPSQSGSGAALASVIRSGGGGASAASCSRTCASAT